MKHNKKMSAILVGVMLISLMSPLSVLAHDEIESGDYLLTIGWVDEPVIVGQPNGLYLYIVGKDAHSEGESHSEGDAHSASEGIAGAETTLNFTVAYGGVERSYELQPSPGNPGLYVARFIPTREGQYTFRLSGTVNGHDVNIEFEPEEVSPAGHLAFPEAAQSSAEIANQIAAAKSQAANAQLIGIVGAALGLAGVGMALFGLRRK